MKTADEAALQHGLAALPELVWKELAALAEMTDEDIDYSDIPATKDEDWIGAVRGRFYRPVKQVTVRKDADISPGLNKAETKAARNA